MLLCMDRFEQGLLHCCQHLEGVCEIKSVYHVHRNTHLCFNSIDKALQYLTSSWAEENLRFGSISTKFLTNYQPNTQNVRSLIIGRKYLCE